MAEGGISQESLEERVQPAKSFKTANGSVYTYDANGKTTRFKATTQEQHIKQDITVFVDLTPDEEQDILHAYRHEREQDRGSKVYVLERQKDNTPKIIRDINEVQDPKSIYIGVLRDGKFIFTKQALITPKVGYSVFDTRHYQENSRWFAERHLGNKVVEITY